MYKSTAFKDERTGQRSRITAQRLMSRHILKEENEEKSRWTKPEQYRNKAWRTCDKLRIDANKQER